MCPRFLHGKYVYYKYVFYSILFAVFFLYFTFHFLCHSFFCSIWSHTIRIKNIFFHLRVFRVLIRFVMCARIRDIYPIRIICMHVCRSAVFLKKKIVFDFWLNQHRAFGFQVVTFFAVLGMYWRDGRWRQWFVLLFLKQWFHCDRNLIPRKSKNIQNWCSSKYCFGIATA